ncbi:MAG: secretin N-terminal domain-containing protein [Planctomycetota bacterium]
MRFSGYFARKRRCRPTQFARSWHRLSAVLVLCTAGGLPAAGQQTVILNGKPVVVGAEGVVAQPVAVPNGAVPNQPAKPPKPGQAAKPGEAGKTDGKGDPAPKVIRRDDINRGDADPKELKATVGEDGRVSFHFRNQPWVDLVDWLSEISGHPIDWLELPADKVNLRSPGRYTVAETRDLFNRHLLARGYTLLAVDGGSAVVKIQTLNPAIVPRVDAEQLGALPDYQFVRTTLDAGWLAAETLVAEFTPLISAGGKLTALKTTNRIDAMGAAINLREIRSVLERERSAVSREALAPEFQLRHLSAETAKEMLEKFLGISEQKNQPTLTPQQLAYMRSRGQRIPTPKQPDISVVANVRQNSLLIRAPADRVAVAMEFLKRVDVPTTGLRSLADIESRVQVFRLASLDPEKLVEIIDEMNVLEPGTRIRVDEDNQALVVSGSAADRFVIASLIKRLDGSGRTFEVMPLRRLDAVEVAESIKFLMGVTDEDDDSSNKRRYFGYSFGYNDNSTKNKDKFRVAANARYRQVLLWANPQEMEQVQSLLIKLGELPPPGGNRQTVRVVDAAATPETLEYLRRIQAQFRRLSPNPIELPELPKEEILDSDEVLDSDDADDGDDAPAGGVAPAVLDTSLRMSAPNDGSASQSLVAIADDETANPDSPETRSQVQSAADFDRLFQRSKMPQSDANPQSDTTSQNDASNAGQSKRNSSRGKPSGGKPPITISFDEDGNLVITSEDTEALDRLENLMIQNAPPRKPYHVFKLEHASAIWIRLNLEDYFDDEEDDDSDSMFPFFYYDDFGSRDDGGPEGLAKRSKLKFVDDFDTNTLVVTGASNSQLRTMKELIKLWDVPEPVNDRRMRYTKLVKIQYGQASSIAETVKEAYRDLLSSNDKAFAGKKAAGGGGGGGSGGGDMPEKSRGGSGFGLTSGDESGGGTNFSFRGKLSLGVDRVGNTILVSAEGDSLLSLVIDTIEQLDEAAQPQGRVEIIEVDGAINGDQLARALRVLSGRSAANNAPAKPGAVAAPTAPAPVVAAPRGRRGRK